MNPDVPSLEACKRLAKAGWPQWGKGKWQCTGMNGPQLLDAYYKPGGETARVAGGADFFESWKAPTLSEMLDYIRRRRYSLKHAIAVALLNQIRARLDAPLKDCFETLLICMTADDLANALSEVLEKEAGKKNI